MQPKKILSWFFDKIISVKDHFEIEFVIKSSPQLLYQYLFTPSGLSEWFADNVNSRGEVFVFIWDGFYNVFMILLGNFFDFFIVFITF